MYEIQQETEWLETTEGDSIECIGIENLEGILINFLDLNLRYHNHEKNRLHKLEALSNRCTSASTNSNLQNL